MCADQVRSCYVLWHGQMSHLLVTTHQSLPCEYHMITCASQRWLAHCLHIHDVRYCAGLLSYLFVTIHQLVTCHVNSGQTFQQYIANIKWHTHVCYRFLLSYLWWRFCIEISWVYIEEFNFNLQMFHVS